MPAPSRFIEFPVTDSDPSVIPWNAFVNESRCWRPVTLRVSLSAASTVFVPVGPGNITV